MAFKLDATPSDAISNETGPPIVTGGTYSGSGTHLVNDTGVPVTAGVLYALTAPSAGTGELHWEVELTTPEYSGTDRDGHGPDGKQGSADAIAGAGVSSRVWRSTADGTARFSLVTTGSVTVATPTVAPHTGRIILTVPGDILTENIMASGGLIAGDPDGARVVIDAEGVAAFDSSGTEAAQITGEGGEFVGGSFRTSDALPGQVTLSSTANQGEPGIAVEPDDSAGYDVLPSIGPGPDHMSISGGVSTEGALAGAQFSADGTTIYHNGTGANGTGSWATVSDGEAGLRYRPDRTNADHESAIRARADDAVVYSEGPNGTGFLSASPLGGVLEHVGPGDPIARSESRAAADPEYLMLERKVSGVTDSHRLVLDDDGVWVKTVNSLNPVSYNLLETAQDSGWQTFDPEAGVTGSAAVAWRNKGGVIYFRGFVTGDWTNGVWNTIASGLNPDWCPSATWVVAEAGGATKGATLRMTADGRLQISPPVTSTTSYYLNAMTYPAG